MLSAYTPFFREDEDEKLRVWVGSAELSGKREQNIRAGFDLSFSLGAEGLLSCDVLFMLDAADFCTHSRFGWINSQVCCVRAVQVDGLQ